MFAVGHFPILTNSLTLQIFCNINLYTHIHISSMNASSFVYTDVVIICTMMSFYQQILHSLSCYKVLCIGNLTYAGHFAVSPSIVNLLDARSDTSYCIPAQCQSGDIIIPLATIIILTYKYINGNTNITCL